MAIVVRLDVEMAKNKIGVNDLSERTGISPSSLSILKNGRAKAVRFSTLESLCQALGCTPGDILQWLPEAAASTTSPDA